MKLSQQFSFAAKSQEDLAADRARDSARYPTVVVRGTPHTPWWRGGLVTSDAPTEQELNACAVRSDALLVESRGDGVYRLRMGDQWADFATVRPFGRIIARYVAGNVSGVDVDEFEDLAALKISEEVK